MGPRGKHESVPSRVTKARTGRATRQPSAMAAHYDSDRGGVGSIPADGTEAIPWQGSRNLAQAPARQATMV